jgi:hypothetical protein
MEKDPVVRDGRNCIERLMVRPFLSAGRSPFGSPERRSARSETQTVMVEELAEEGFLPWATGGAD